jgi:hydrogenase large subunit
MASSMTLEAAFGAVPPTNGRILRNLVLGSNFVQSHVLHFYHLAALDYIDTSGILDLAPWSPRYVTPDMIGGSLAQTLVQHYLQALAIRRKAHQMGAIFGGRLPCTASFVPGGCTAAVVAEDIASFRSLLTEIRGFIDSVYIPDVLAVGNLFPQYYQIGTGCGTPTALLAP